MKKAVQAASPSAKVGHHTRSSRSRAMKRSPARTLRCSSSCGAGGRCGTKTATRKSETRYVAASITSTGVAPINPISRPASAGPARIVTRFAPWKSAFASVTRCSSSPISSGTMTFCAA
jgi:hypothetical protein